LEAETTNRPGVVANLRSLLTSCDGVKLGSRLVQLRWSKKL
jgi:hypothetical protein